MGPFWVVTIEGPDDDVGEAVEEVAKERLIVEELVEEDPEVLELDGIEEVPGRELELVEGIPVLDPSTDLDNDADPDMEATEF
jgi:hypothetical protein